PARILGLVRCQGRCRATSSKSENPRAGEVLGIRTRRLLRNPVERLQLLQPNLGKKFQYPSRPFLLAADSGWVGPGTPAAPTGRQIQFRHQEEGSPWPTSEPSAPEHARPRPVPCCTSRTTRVASISTSTSLAMAARGPR